MYVCAACSNRKEDPHIGNQFSQLPQLYITADSSLVDTIYHVNRRKIPAYAVFVTTDGDTLYDDSLKYIRTRGNSTFAIPAKKAFTIKFAYPARIPRLEKAKKFILLANALDEGHSHIRNAIAFDIASKVGLLVPNYIYITLYINNEYKGLYQMTNAVDVNKKIVNIVDLERENKIVNGNNNLAEYMTERYEDMITEGKGYILPQLPHDISGGYLLTYNGRGAYERSGSGFISSLGDPIGIKSPQHASLQEVRYIHDFYNQMENAVIDTTSQKYLDYIDVESFAKYYMIQEILVNSDACTGSVYMYKDLNGKLVAGPIWDMDGILSPEYSTRYTYDLPANMIWAADIQPLKMNNKSLFQRMWERKDFQVICKHIYQDEISKAIHDYIECGSIDSLYTHLANEAENDNSINGYYSQWDESTYQSVVEIPKNYLQERLEFFDWFYNTPDSLKVCLTDLTEPIYAQDRIIYIYFEKGKPITLPDRNNKAIRTPTPTWYIAGTDSVLTNGMRLYRDYDIECRLVPPSKTEMMRRRIKKYLHGRLFY